MTEGGLCPSVPFVDEAIDYLDAREDGAYKQYDKQQPSAYDKPIAQVLTASLPAVPPERLK